MLGVRYLAIISDINTTYSVIVFSVVFRKKVYLWSNCIRVVFMLVDHSRDVA